MLLTNEKIFIYAQACKDFNDTCTTYIPTKINFTLQKNIAQLSQLTEDIEKERVRIAQHYGVLNEEGTSYVVPSEKIAQVNNEIECLLSMEQEVSLIKLSLDDFNNIELTPKQMQALMFMIEE